MRILLPALCFILSFTHKLTYHYHVYLWLLGLYFINQNILNALSLIWKLIYSKIIDTLSPFLRQLYKSTVHRIIKFNSNSGKNSIHFYPFILALEALVEI